MRFLASAFDKGIPSANKHRILIEQVVRQLDNILKFQPCLIININSSVVEGKTANYKLRLPYSIDKKKKKQTIKSIDRPTFSIRGRLKGFKRINLFSGKSLS